MLIESQTMRTFKQKKVRNNIMPSIKNETSKGITVTECEVLKARQFKNSRVGFDLKINGVVIYSMIAFPYKDKQGNDAWGISFPQRKGSDNKYYNECYFYINDDLRKNLLEQIDKLLEQN